MSARERIYRYANPDEREEVASRINPETAEVFFIYGPPWDPYGDDAATALPEERWPVGRVFFAVDPEEGVAVSVWDLPEATRKALATKERAADRQGWMELCGFVPRVPARPPSGSA